MIEYEERAAILEYDGGLSRAEAEQRAAAIIERERQQDRIRQQAWTPPQRTLPMGEP